MGSQAIEDLKGKLGLDTTDYVAGVRAANREMRVLETEFRASAAALGDWSKDATGLEKRIESLTGQMDVQKLKVAALNEQYRNMAEGGEASQAALQNLQIEINKETERLNKMTNELGDTRQALDELGDESGDAADQVDELGDKSEDAGQKLNLLGKVASGLKATLAVGIAAVTGLVTAVVGVGAAVTKLVLDTAKASGELVDLSAKTGVSTERLQELSYVGDQVGTSAETMTGSMARLTRAMDDARQKADGDTAAAFAQLGVRVTDANGNLRDSEAVFADAIDALGKISNETDRDALAMQLFGKSAQELNPLIKAGSAELARLSKEAHEVGAVVSDETVTAMAEFDDKLSSLQAGLKGTLAELGGAFLPFFSGLADQAKGYLKEFSQIVRGADGDLGKMASGLGSLLGRIISDAARQGPEMLQAGLNIVQGILNAIVQNLPALIGAAVQMLSTLVQFLVQNLPLLMRAGVDVLLALVNGILPQLPMLVEAAIQMMVTLANGLADAIPRILPVVAEVIPKIVLALIENLPLLIDAALKLILALAKGLVDAIPVLLPYIPQIVEAIFDALIALLPLIAEAALELVKTLALGILNNLPLIGQTAGEILGTLFKGLQALDQQIRDTGKAIVEGIWQGMTASSDWLLKQVTGFLAGIVNGAKSALGIHSPSTVFAGIGENMALGLGAGFQDAFRDIQNQVSGAVGNLGDVAVSPGGSSAPGASSSTDIAAAARGMVVEVRDVSGLLDLRNLARNLAPYINEELVLLRS